MLTGLILAMASLALATGCSTVNSQEAEVEPATQPVRIANARVSSSQTARAADNPVEPVNVPATVSAELTRTAPVPAPTIDVEATVAAVLTRVAPPTPSPIPSPVMSASTSVSDIVANLEAGLVQIITPSASGSGFAVSNDGLIITNAHVVGEHDTVTVRSVTGLAYTGVVRGKDEELDLAVVKIGMPGNIKAMPLGEVSEVRTGDTVIAMGFPLSDQLGDSYTVTTGVVSSRRKVGPGERIQTDAAINAGSSGGPLVNRAGEVIGVNTTTYREYQGISFAVSIDEVKNNLRTLAAEQSTLTQVSGEFQAYHNETCYYSLRVPSGWWKVGEDAGCRISLGRLEGDMRAGAIHIWDYPLNDGETLDDFSAWWSDNLAERGSGWKSFTHIQSEKSTVERDGKPLDQYVIQYHWQETEKHCVSFATDRIVVSNHQGIALVFSASVCDFMPPAVFDEIAGMEFDVWVPTPVFRPAPTPQP